MTSIRIASDKYAEFDVEQFAELDFGDEVLFETTDDIDNLLRLLVKLPWLKFIKVSFSSEMSLDMLDRIVKEMGAGRPFPFFIGSVWVEYSERGHKLLLGDKSKDNEKLMRVPALASANVINDFSSRELVVKLGDELRFDIDEGLIILEVSEDVDPMLLVSALKKRYQFELQVVFMSDTPVVSDGFTLKQARPSELQLDLAASCPLSVCDFISCLHRPDKGYTLASLTVSLELGEELAVCNGVNLVKRVAGLAMKRTSGIVVEGSVLTLVKSLLGDQLSKTSDATYSISSMAAHFHGKRVAYLPDPDVPVVEEEEEAYVAGSRV